MSDRRVGVKGFVRLCHQRRGVRPIEPCETRRDLAVVGVQIRSGIAIRIHLHSAQSPRYAAGATRCAWGRGFEDRITEQSPELARSIAQARRSLAR